MLRRGLAVLALLFLALVAVVIPLSGTVMAADYEELFPDPPGDASPSYVDINYVVYAYDSEKITFLFSVRGDINNCYNSAYHYRVYMDVDNDPSTGYQVPGFPVGAEYFVSWNYVGPTSPAKLFRYVGSGSDWSWDVVSNPGIFIGSYQVKFDVQKSDLSNPGLGSEINILYETYVEGEGRADTVYPNKVLPVPEPSLLIAGGIALGVGIAFIYLYRRSMV